MFAQESKSITYIKGIVISYIETRGSVLLLYNYVDRATHEKFNEVCVTG